MKPLDVGMFLNMVVTLLSHFRPWQRHVNFALAALYVALRVYGILKKRRD